MSGDPVEPTSLVHLRLQADWREGHSQHTAIHHFPKVHLWRDLELLPAPLRRDLLGRPAGWISRYEFAAGELIPDWNPGLLHRLASRHLRPRRHSAVRPSLGRFFPRGWVSEGVPGIFSQDMRPMRLAGLGAGCIVCDFNHPLAGRALTLEMEVLSVAPTETEHGGRCTDCVADLLTGPGMQMRHQGQATDFGAPEPYRRLDEYPDSYFYSLPRLLSHLDQQALAQLTALHGRLLAGRRRVLDLMASWDSHLPADLPVPELTGIGLNQDELAANPRLGRRIVQDLNQYGTLPLADASLDAVICSLSVEYLTRPRELFQEVARVLVPGGLFLTSFSNRWFPTKAIHLWNDLHEFERMGLVSELFHATPAFGAPHSLSIRGLPRPEDDAHAEASPWSDPIYAVWALTQPHR